MNSPKPFSARRKRGSVALTVLTLALHISSSVRAADPAPALGKGSPGGSTSASTKSGVADAARTGAARTSAESAVGATSIETSAKVETKPQSNVQATTESSAAVGSGSGLFDQSVSEASATKATSETAQPAVDLNGYIRADTFVGQRPNSQEGELKAAYGELALKLKTKKQTYGDAYAEARFRYGLEGSERNLFLDLREAYVNAYLGPIDLRLGQQIVVWGRADALNPTNNLTPSNLRIRSPFEDDWRVGNVGARMFVNLAPLRIEGVWMPVYVASELPDVLPAFATFANPRFPTPTLGNGTQGVRVHLERPSFETSVSYVYGYAPMPGLACGADARCLHMRDYDVGEGDNPAVIRVSRRAYRHHVLGFDFSTAIGELVGVRGEVAYRRPVDYNKAVVDGGSPFTADAGRVLPGDLPRPDLQYVLGLDHTFGAVSVIAQYVGRYTFDWQQERRYPRAFGIDDFQTLEPATVEALELQDTIRDAINGELRVRNQMLFSQLAQVQHIASLRLEWLTLHDTLSLSALSMVNFTTKETAVFPRLGYQFSDSMSGYLGGQIYAGPTDTLFGTVQYQLSAGYMELRLSY